MELSESPTECAAAHKAKYLNWFKLYVICAALLFRRRVLLLCLLFVRRLYACMQVNISHEDREDALAALENRPGAQAVGAGLFDEALVQVTLE